MAATATEVDDDERIFLGLAKRDGGRGEIGGELYCMGVESSDW